jgi:serine/threonine protein kinase
MHQPTSGPQAGSCQKRYRILGRLGVGGMGVVYEAQDQRLHRTVALKVGRHGPADGADAWRQFEREASAMARAQSPHVCAVYDLADVNGRPCLVMERLEGRTLRTRMDAGPLETLDVLDIAHQIAEALEAVHQAGLIHQDIKPSNLFVTAAGAVKLLDFGLAESRDQADDTPRRPIARPSVFGTTNYIAPERILRRPADHRSDLFSLGAVLYEMSTGRQPFAGASPAEALFNVLDKTPAPVRSQASGRVLPVDPLVRKLLAKNPEQRYRSAADVRRALAAIRAGALMPGPQMKRSRPSTMRGVHHAVHNDNRAQWQ